LWDVVVVVGTGTAEVVTGSKVVVGGGVEEVVVEVP